MTRAASLAIIFGLIGLFYALPIEQSESLVVSPELIDLGEVKPGGSIPFQIRIKNPGPYSNTDSWRENIMCLH